MIPSSLRKFSLFFFSLPVVLMSLAQAATLPPSTHRDTPSIKIERPYKLLTTGHKITIQSSQPIKRILGWTASGHRFVENNNVDGTSCSFELPASERIGFVMVQLKDGRHWTEKVGAE
jgi:hypothetical protein